MNRETGNTVSVIDGNNNTKIGKDIPVGTLPSAVDVNSYTNTIYVANQGENSVSVIDAKANKVVAKVIFNTEPFNAGRIECDKEKLIVPVAEEFYMWPGSQCTAKPNQGFEFVSWQENLGHNSTQLISFVPLPSIVDSILEFFHVNQDKPEATLNITKFGSFTANFRALPPSIPPEYVATLFTVVATAFIGSWLTPTVIGWRNAKKQVGKFDQYYNEIKKADNDANVSDNLIDEITDEYTRGKINKESYDKLLDEISLSYGEIFTKEIDSLNNVSENDKEKQLSVIINNLEEMHAKGKIKNEYYTKLKKETSILYQEIFRTRLDSLKSLAENKGKLLDEIKEDISDAYSKGKISDLHYTLLEKKLSNYEKPKT
jgi:YVTN family beta-propeller protein